jgi:AcrR family transcriptional regulator
MIVRDERRAAMLERIADHLLRQGLAQSSLRALATAVGTSDRMLLYYFADKEDLLGSALRTVTARLATLLAQTLPEGEPRGVETVLRELAGVVRGDAVRPYMQLWLEMTIASARGEEPFRSLAGAIAEGFVGWVETRLAMKDAGARQAAAARIVALLDGLVVLDLVGQGTTADLALREDLPL